MKKRLVFALSILALSAAVSCSFFEPRDPAYPDPGEEIPWQPPYAPATVVINLENAMEGRSIANTMACCDSSYMFIANGADIAEFGGSWNFSNWDYEVEQNTMMNLYYAVQDSLLPDDSLISVTMNSIDSLPDPVYPVDSVDIWRDYEIVAAGLDSCGWERPAKGRVMFQILEDNYGLWTMKRWYDYRPDDYTGGFLTWGVVKATVR